MATAGNKANWSDITALYTKLNTARQKFSFATVTAPNNQGQLASVSDITTLNSFITQMQSNANLTTVATAVTPPAIGDLLKPLFVNTLSTTIDNIQNANSILIVYIEVPSHTIKTFKTIPLIKQCFNDIKNKFPNKNIKMLYIGHKNWFIPINIKFKLSRDIMLVITNYRSNCKKNMNLKNNDIITFCGKCKGNICQKYQ